MNKTLQAQGLQTEELGLHPMLLGTTDDHLRLRISPFFFPVTYQCELVLFKLVGTVCINEQIGKYAIFMH